MGNFNSAVLTAKGNELLTSAVAGRRIIFTRLVTGSGVYTEEEKTRAALEQRTALKQQRQEFTFSSYEKVSQTSVLLTSLITNRELTEGYKMTEIGIYGKENDAEEDFLCSISVTSSLEESDTFPAFNGLRESQIIQDYYITISNTAEVTVKMTGAPALAEDLEKIKNTIQQEIRVLQEEKVNIVVTDKYIPIAERKEKTFYLINLGSGPLPTNDTIKISPYFGAKIVERGSKNE